MFSFFLLTFFLSLSQGGTREWWFPPSAFGYRHKRRGEEKQGGYYSSFFFLSGLSYKIVHTFQLRLRLSHPRRLPVIPKTRRKIKTTTPTESSSIRTWNRWHSCRQEGRNGGERSVRENVEDAQDKEDEESKRGRKKQVQKNKTLSSWWEKRRWARCWMCMTVEKCTLTSKDKVVRRRRGKEEKWQRRARLEDGGCWNTVVYGIVNEKESKEQKDSGRRETRCRQDGGKMESMYTISY